jgi:hypothetical protein
LSGKGRTRRFVIPKPLDTAWQGQFSGEVNLPGWKEFLF